METRVGPKLLESAPQEGGQAGKAEARARPGVVQAGGSSPAGAGKPLRSRPMISLTAKEGQLRDWGRGKSPHFPEMPQSNPGRPQSRTPLGSFSTGFSFTGPQCPQCVLPPTPNQILSNSVHMGSQAPFPAHSCWLGLQCVGSQWQQDRCGRSQWQEEEAKQEGPHHQC
jgi:hypothetical protein